ncbi:MAG: long-chain fatty acid--CoA ligase [Archaeoglobaceae archaeon]|nr:long-chain fatty acid--CoA ligase [Archaeoglobaceae archaeon]
MSVIKKVVKGAELKIEKKETLNEMLWNTVRDYPNTPAVTFYKGEKLVSISYRDFWNQVEKLSKGLIEKGVKKGDRVAILSETRYEWELFDFAIMCCGAIVVPIHTTLNKETVQYILHDSGAKLVVLENNGFLEKLGDYEIDVVTIEDGENSMETLLNLGEKSSAKFEETWRSVRLDDISSIVYTSGTTGEPKGSILTHWNWRFNTISIMSITPFYPGEPYICYLPLSHVFQRIVFFCGVSRAANAVFTPPKKFLETLKTVKPVAFVTVPRILERVNRGLIENIEKQREFKKRIFYWARNVAIECGKKMSKGEKFGTTLEIKRKIADKLVYRKIRNALGLQNIRFICSAAAELHKDLAYMFNGMGISVIEGYGLTETAAATNLNPLQRFKPGTVGPPVPGIIEAIAEDGEILIKGDNVMLGYWNKPEETKKCFTEDGWFKTGDIGDFDDEGYLIFHERKKHIIALDTGKKVAPSRLEDLLLKNPYISDALIIGDNKPYISAIIVPNFTLLLAWLEKNGISFDKSCVKVSKSVSGDLEVTEVPENIVNNPTVVEFYSKIIDEVNEKLSKEEKIKKFILLNKVFSIDRNELTPTLKKRVHVIMDRYKDLIERLYTSQ